VTLRIGYVGAGLGGKTTSIYSVRRRAGCPDEWTPGKHEHTFDVDIDLRPARVALRPAVCGAWLGDDVHPAVVAELDWLARADGFVNVVESRASLSEYVLYSQDELTRRLATRGVQIERVPTVFQINKRDLPNICTVAWVREHLRADRCAYVESVATNDIGTWEAFTALVELIRR
jgi:hypothetical protein